MTPEQIKEILVKHRAWLSNEPGGSRADLSGADLSGAILSGADLRGADLSGADLRGAILSGADLSGADLLDADLSGAILSGADLRGADLSGADLRGAILSGADLSGADLLDADLSGAILSVAEIPFVPDLDKAIHAAVCGASAPGKLDMSSWHDEACQTTHCRAGWAIHLAGEPGYALEKEIGPAAAGALIYHRSTGRIPDFYASNEIALAEICELAEKV